MYSTTASPMPSRVSISQESTSKNGDQYIAVTITPPSIHRDGDISARNPVIVCVCIDTSYSMSDQVARKTETGEIKKDGLTILDLVKHAARTLVDTLEDDDIFNLVAYSDSGRVVCERLYCNVANKLIIKEAINSLVVDGQTNIWDGLSKSLDTIYTRETRDECNRHKTILLLTDGRPNKNPPRGIVPMLEKVKEEREMRGLDNDVSINTFGFGDNLDSDLLKRIAKSGNGMYGFIPGADFVGTVLTNTFANELITCGTNMDLAISLKDGGYGIDELKCLGYEVEQESKTKGIIKLGYLRYMQPRAVVFMVPSEKTENLIIESVKCSFTDIASDKLINAETTGPIRNSDVPEIINMVLLHSYRVQLVDEINRLISYSEVCQDDFVRFKAYLNTELLKINHAYSVALREELNGQITEAMSDKYISKWGKHYLRSVIMAHLNEETINFKDAALQHYGSAMFRYFRDICEDIFIKSPAPIPTGQIPYTASATARAPAPRIDMLNYYNASGGCISPKCLVSSGENSLIYVRDIRKGDVINCPDSPNGKSVVEYVLKYKVGKTDQVVKFSDGLIISPYHPILKTGTCFSEWVFPLQLKTPEDINEEEVFNFVLKSGNVMIINNRSVITLGHDIKGHDVLSHEYLGTHRVIDDIKEIVKNTAHDTDHVEIKEIIRDPVTGQICKMK